MRPQRIESTDTANYQCPRNPPRPAQESPIKARRKQKEEGLSKFPNTNRIEFLNINKSQLTNTKSRPTSSLLI